MSYKEKRETISKKDCKCDACGKPIKAGAPCIVDPKAKTVIHTACAKK